MSETPKTDVLQRMLVGLSDVKAIMAMWAHARQLERDLAAANAELTDLRAEVGREVALKIAASNNAEYYRKERNAFDRERKESDVKVRELEGERRTLMSEASNRIERIKELERELARLSGASGSCVECERLTRELELANYRADDLAKLDEGITARAAAAEQENERLTRERDEALVKAGKYDHWCGLKRANGEPLRKGGPCACQFDMDYPDQPLGWCSYHANLRNERDESRAYAGKLGLIVTKQDDTLKRIATEFTALHSDSDKCDSIGEIYHLLREAGAIEEET